MIRYALVCGKGHGFDSWFASADTCDRLLQAGAVTCPVCETAAVSKALMAPAVARKSSQRRRVALPMDIDAAPKSAATPPPPPPPVAPAQTLLAPNPRERALREKIEALRAEIRTRFEDVGEGFAREVRAIAAGEAEERPIFGKATAPEVRALLEDDLPVLPLPFDPKGGAAH